MRMAVDDPGLIEEAERQKKLEAEKIGLNLERKNTPKAKKPKAEKEKNWLKEWEEKHDQDDEKFTGQLGPDVVKKN